MGDVRFQPYLERIQASTNPSAEIRELTDDGIIQALAATSREGDPYLSNVLATEAMNRMRRSRTIVAHVGEGIYALDLRGRVTFVNPSAERMLGWSRSEMLGRPMHGMMHHTGGQGEAQDPDACAILTPLRTGETVELEAEVFTRRDGTTFPVSVVSAPILHDGTIEGVVVAFRDVTERKRSEALLAGQTRVLERMAAPNMTLPETLDSLARFIEDHAEGLLASILLLDPDGRRLRHGAAPSLPDTYIRAIDGVRPGPGVGSCGTAAHLGEPVHVTDIRDSPLWEDFADIAAEHDLHACWSTPIRATDGTLLGTFALYYREPRAPSEYHLRLIDVATRLAALAIERARAEENLRTRAAIVQSATDAVLSVDLEGRINGWNRAAGRLFGYAPEEITGEPLTRLIPPNRLGEDRLLLGRVLRGERVRSYRTQGLTRDGRIVDLLLSAFPIYDADGNIVGASAIPREPDSNPPPPTETRENPGESDRLDVLHRYNVLDTPPEQEFDDLARLARDLCEAPIALLTLVDEHRQFFKAHIGLDLTGTALDASFCIHAIQNPDETLVVEDAREDARFADNPLVTGPPHLRFYAGAPLTTTSGHALGTLCVLDKVPRSLTPEQRRILEVLARQAVSHLELRRAVADLSRDLDRCGAGPV